MSIAQPKTDDEWNARQDAHTLKEATAIQGDKDRLAKATKALAQLEKEAQEALDAIQKVRDLPSKMYPSMKDTDKDGK
jgi:hypothetical protein